MTQSTASMKTCPVRACTNRPYEARSSFNGEGGIRTRGTLSGTLVFETSTISRSVTSPDKLLCCAGRLLVLVHGTNGDCTVGLAILQGTVAQSWKYVYRLTPIMGQDGQKNLGKPNILRYKHNLTALSGTIGAGGCCAMRTADRIKVWIHEAICSRRQYSTFWLRLWSSWRILILLRS